MTVLQSVSFATLRVSREKGKEENNGGGLSLDLLFPQNLTKKIIVSVGPLNQESRQEVLSKMSPKTCMEFSSSPPRAALPSVIAILGSFCEAGGGRGRGWRQPPLPGRPQPRLPSLTTADNTLQKRPLPPLAASDLASPQSE